MNPELMEVRKQMLQLAMKARDLQQAQTPEPITTDYRLETANGSVTLSELMGDRDELIVIHNMGKGCSYCTLWADGFNGFRKPLEDRAAFVVVSPDDTTTQAEFAASRGWNFRMASDQDKSFTKDMGYLDDDGNWHPGVSGFARQPDGSIARTGRDYLGPFDTYCSVWHLFGLLPEQEWHPKMDYDVQPA